MKAKLLTKLTEQELINYKGSSLYKNFVLSSYQFLDNSIGYYNEYFNNEYSDYSLIVLDELQIPLLVLHAYSKPPVFSHFDLPILIIESSFIDSHQKDKAYRELLKRLNETLVNNNFEKIKFYLNDFLCAEYYTKISTTGIEYNSYVDLSLSEEEIKSNIRKSYKSLVNWGEKNLKTNLIDHANADFEKFSDFRDFHIAIAGRKTRSEKSWSLQFELIKRNEGFLVLGYYNEQLASGSLILYGKNEAYYGVGVYDRELMSKNIAVGHYNILYAIYHAKKIGLNSINLGFLSNVSNNEKEKNIFKFKAGFTNRINLLVHFVCNLNPQTI